MIICPKNGGTTPWFETRSLSGTPNTGFAGFDGVDGVVLSECPSIRKD